MASQTQENYLKCIYRITEKNDFGASTNAIASMLQTSAATVTDMLRKLERKKYIVYQKYKPVTLTQSGKTKALLIIRSHRLWEVFLVNKLGFKWDEVHDLAEQLEHVQSKELISRLDVYLGSPKVDPHGDYIPDSKGKMQTRRSVPLSMARAGTEIKITGVDKQHSDFLHYLDQNQLHIGKRIMLIKVNEFDGSCNIKLKGQQHIFISREMAENIFVQ